MSVYGLNFNMTAYEGLVAKASRLELYHAYGGA